MCLCIDRRICVCVFLGRHGVKVQVSSKRGALARRQSMGNAN